MSLWFITMMPFIIYLLITIIVVRFIFKKAKHFQLTKRPTKIIIGIYIVLLVASVALYPALTSSNSLYLTDEKAKKQLKLNKVFEQNALANKLTEEDEKYLVDKWTYILKGEELYLKQVSPDEYINEQVIVHWTDNRKQQIEGKVYKTRNILSNMDFSEKVKPTMISWSDEHTLNFENPDSYTFEGNLFTDEIGLFPFANRGFNTFDFDKNIGADGSTYVILKVPKHINVIDENGLRMYPPVEY
jgi:flagellar basal body-associated protein FliL